MAENSERTGLSTFDLVLVVAGGLVVVWALLWLVGVLASVVWTLFKLVLLIAAIAVVAKLIFGRR